MVILGSNIPLKYSTTKTTEWDLGILTFCVLLREHIFSGYPYLIFSNENYTVLASSQYINRFLKALNFYIILIDQVKISHQKKIQENICLNGNTYTKIRYEKNNRCKTKQCIYTIKCREISKAIFEKTILSMGMAQYVYYSLAVFFGAKFISLQEFASKKNL